jgi:hypothetical protein
MSRDQIIIDGSDLLRKGSTYINLIKLKCSRRDQEIVMDLTTIQISGPDECLSNDVYLLFIVATHCAGLYHADLYSLTRVIYCGKGARI